MNLLVLTGFRKFVTLNAAFVLADVIHQNVPISTFFAAEVNAMGSPQKQCGAAFVCYDIITNTRV